LSKDVADREYAKLESEYRLLRRKFNCILCRFAIEFLVKEKLYFEA